MRLIIGEMKKNEAKFDCVTCKTTLSEYNLVQHLKTKMYLDNVNDITNKII